MRKLTTPMWMLLGLIVTLTNLTIPTLVYADDSTSCEKKLDEAKAIATQALENAEQATEKAKKISKERDDVVEQRDGYRTQRDETRTERDNLAGENAQLKNQNELLRIEILEKEATADRLTEELSASKTWKWVWLGVGVLGGGALVYGGCRTVLNCSVD